MEREEKNGGRSSYEDPGSVGCAQDWSELALLKPGVCGGGTLLLLGSCVCPVSSSHPEGWSVRVSGDASDLAEGMSLYDTGAGRLVGLSVMSCAWLGGRGAGDEGFDDELSAGVPSGCRPGPSKKIVGESTDARDCGMVKADNRGCGSTCVVVVSGLMEVVSKAPSSVKRRDLEPLEGGCAKSGAGLS